MSLEEYRSIRQWLSNLAPSTQRINLYVMKIFLSWVEENSEKYASYSPDDFVEYQLLPQDYINSLDDSIIKKEGK